MSAMPENYRFRKNWLGQLVLQVSYQHHVSANDTHDTGDSYLAWRDANYSDFNNSFFDRRKTS
jgi:hypothetical protein